MIYILLLSLSVFLPATFASDLKMYNVEAYGALANGKTVNKSAIQKAIDVCNQNGGGSVIIPAGNFVAGTIRLLSNVNLHLEPGARLTGSPDIKDYSVDGVRHGMIYAHLARNISITGTGKIYGQGSLFHEYGRTHILRDFDRKYTRQGDQYAPDSIFPPDGPIEHDLRPGMMIVFSYCERNC